MNFNNSNIAHHINSYLVLHKKRKGTTTKDIESCPFYPFLDWQEKKKAIHTTTRKEEYESAKVVYKHHPKGKIRKHKRESKDPFLSRESSKATIENGVLYTNILTHIKRYSKQ